MSDGIKLGRQPGGGTWRRGVNFIPRNRGDVMAALAAGDLRGITVPRNVVLLNRTIFSDRLTASDLALLEIMLTVTRQSHGDDTPSDAPACTIRCRDLIKMMGWQKNPKYLMASLVRLNAGEFGVVKGWHHKKRAFPLFSSALATGEDTRGDDILYFQLSSELFRLLSLRTRYFYVELHALTRMRSKHSQSVYKFLAASSYQRVVDLRPGNESGAIGRWFDFPMCNLAKEINWIRPRKAFNAAVFKRDVVRHLATDLGHVAAFRVQFESNEIILKKTGTMVDNLKITLYPAIPNWRTFKIPRKEDFRDKYLTKYDMPELMVPVTFFKRVARYLGCDPRDLYHLWLFALVEYCKDEAIDPEYDRRTYRGHRLIDFALKHGNEEACWGLILEELDGPSLSCHLDNKEMVIRAINDRNIRALGPGCTISVDGQAAYRKAIKPTDGRTLSQVALAWSDERWKTWNASGPAPQPSAGLLAQIKSDMAEMRRERQIWQNVSGQVEPTHVAEAPQVMTEDERLRAEVEAFEDTIRAAREELFLEDDLPCVGDNSKWMIEEIDRAMAQIPF